jgi:hypothetical protein
MHKAVHKFECGQLPRIIAVDISGQTDGFAGAMSKPITPAPAPE